MRKSSLLALLVAAVAVGACGKKPACLVDQKETATVLEVDNACNARFPDQCLRYTDYTYQRLRMQRDSDGTVCTAFNDSWMYKPGDKIRGPL